MALFSCSVGGKSSLRFARITFVELRTHVAVSRFGTRRIKANQVYQEYIQERHHLHMNATRWVSLSEFVKHLGREGVAHVEEIINEGEHGWYITWIDRSPGALSRQDALQKMERAKMDEEGRQRKFLNEQIEKAKQQEEAKRGESVAQARSVEEGLQRRSNDKPLKIGLSLSKATPTSSEGSATSAPATSLPENKTAPPVKIAANPFKIKAAPKLGGAFKATPASGAVSPAPVSTSTSSAARNSTMTAAERIMAEEQERKDKRKLMGPQPSAKRMRL